MTILWSDAARLDLHQAYRFYRDSVGARMADRFRASIANTVELIGMFPEIGAVGSHGCRQKPTVRFPYAIIYRVLEESIQIIALAHSSREPGFWADRPSGKDDDVR